MLAAEVGLDGEAMLRLIERNRNDLVTAEVADVAQFDGEIVARLPLDVERVVDGVGQLVGAVVDAERDRAGRSSSMLPAVGQVVVEVGGLGIGRRGVWSVVP